MKIGVVFAKAGQKTSEEMFANGKHFCYQFYIVVYIKKKKKKKGRKPLVYAHFPSHSLSFFFSRNVSS